MPSQLLPPGIEVFERGWFSSNNIFNFGEADVSIVDTGYCAHQNLTVDLVKLSIKNHHLLGLNKVVNTHLHSDHCGGNAALIEEFHCDVFIPNGEDKAVKNWDMDLLSYKNLGQDCPQFMYPGLLISGQEILLGRYQWEILASPGHDQHSIVLYQNEYQLLISADALWEKGIGVIFPEPRGEICFEEASNTLDLIEGRQIKLVIPGHGKPFSDVGSAISTARSRLDYFAANPKRNARHTAKVLLKYKLLDWRTQELDKVSQWISCTPVFLALARRLDMQLPEFIDWLPKVLVESGVAKLENNHLINVF